MLSPQLRHKRNVIHAQEDPVHQPLSNRLTRSLLVYCLRVMTCPYWCLLLLYLSALRGQNNILVDWVHTYASVANQSACWVYTEIPLSTASHHSPLQLLSQIGLGYRSSGTVNIPCGM